VSPACSSSAARCFAGVAFFGAASAARETSSSASYQTLSLASSA
jgi:hypothetical protein